MGEYQMGESIQFLNLFARLEFSDVSHCLEI